MKHLLILLIALTATGCAHTYQPVCRHNALFAAETVQDLTGQEVRLAIYRIDGKLRHVQAETRRDGKWRPLHVPIVTIMEGKPDLPYDPVSYIDPELYRKVHLNWMRDYRLWKERKGIK